MLHAAECLVNIDEAPRAVSLLESLPTDEAKLQFEAGVLFSRTTEYAASKRHFEEAQHNPSFYDLAGYNRVLILIKERLYEEAVTAAGSMISGGHETGELDALLSEAYRAAGRMEDAYNALRRATHLNPEGDSYYAELADICRELNKYDLGFKIAEIGLHHVPKSSKIHTQRGLLQMAVGHTNESIADLKMAASLAPHDTLPSLALSVLWMQTGQNNQAISLLRRETSSHPNDFAAWYLLAKALIRSGGSRRETVQESISALKQSIQLNDDYAPSRVALGKMLLDAGQIQAAIKELESSIKINPNNQSGLYQLTLAYRRTGNFERAKELGARVREMNAAELEKASLDPSLFHSVQQLMVKQN